MDKYRVNSLYIRHQFGFLMKNFCTITTFSHLYKTYALADSINKIGGNLKVLLVDNENETRNNAPQNVFFYFLKDLNEEIALKIQEKYPPKSDPLRWSLKPVFLKHLLQAFDKMIYVDNDIYFYHDTDFLFEELNKYDILLTPHHYPKNPEKNQNWLEANFRRGLYNAGFFACNQKASKALDLWANCCLYRCENNVWRGLFVDQKYLDIIPLIHENTHILKHRGCNVAAWNKAENKKVKVKEVVLINEVFPIVFYHFNELSIREICLDKKHVLKDYFQLYFKNLKHYKPNLQQQDLYKRRYFKEVLEVFVWKTFHKLNLL